MKFTAYLWVFSAIYAVAGFLLVVMGRKLIELKIRVWGAFPRPLAMFLLLVGAVAYAALAYGGFTTPGLGEGWRFVLVAGGLHSVLNLLVLMLTLRGPIGEHFMAKPWLGFSRYCYVSGGLAFLLVGYAFCLMARTVHALA